MSETGNAVLLARHLSLSQHRKTTTCKIRATKANELSSKKNLNSDFKLALTLAGLAIIIRITIKIEAWFIRFLLSLSRSKAWG